MPSGKATKPGDIVVASNGVTIEASQPSRLVSAGGRSEADLRCGYRSTTPTPRVVSLSPMRSTTLRRSSSRTPSSTSRLSQVRGVCTSRMPAFPLTLSKHAGAMMISLGNQCKLDAEHQRALGRVVEDRGVSRFCEIKLTSAGSWTVSGVFTNSDSLWSELDTAGASERDRVWVRSPLARGMGLRNRTWLTRISAISVCPSTRATCRRSTALGTCVIPARLAATSEKTDQELAS